MAYIGRRISALLVILLGSTFILFNLAAISGDPTQGLRGSTDPHAKAQLAALIRNLHLNVPPPARYFVWLKGIVVGNFGSTNDGNPVSTYLGSALPTTIRLIFLSTIFAIVLGVAFGIISALRQYSRFDYTLTLFAFLMFSLPVFWVAVLLKQYMAIGFNNFLAAGKISVLWILGASLASAIFWGSVISGTRKRFWSTFTIAGATTAVILELINLIHWFDDPGLGIGLIAIFGVGIAYGTTFLSTGLSNKSALRASLSMAAMGTILYYPDQYFFKHFAGFGTLLLMGIITGGLAVASGIFFSKVDRAPAVRTSVITALLIGLMITVDRLMQTWKPYIATDAVNGRPIPTISQSNSLLPSGNFWMSFLDALLHLLLPTIALTLISFAGYIRYSRGTLLEVMSQDYIRTARAKGLPERTVIMRHAFRNTLIPLTTIVVVDFAAIVGGAIITERVFGWQGMGTIFNRAITTYDLNLLMGFLLITSSLVVIANLVADLLYAALDPRIRVVG